MKTATPQNQSAAKPAPFAAPTGLLQRKCACGGSAGLDGECEACRDRRLSRKAREGASPMSREMPPSVGETLDSPGIPLDGNTRRFMEPRFGHDFSQVRIHTDGRAQESARAVNALAYTVGSDVVFGPGQFQPETRAGQRLLAHELTHVAQQASFASPAKGNAGEALHPQLALDIDRPNDPMERQAEANAAAIADGKTAPPVSLEAATVLRRIPDNGGSPGSGRPGSTLPYREATELAECLRIMGDQNRAYCYQEVTSGTVPPMMAGGGTGSAAPASTTALDANAQRIITLAQDATQPVADRAIATVRAIINQYYPADASKVSSIVFQDGEPGLSTTYNGTGANMTGIITVGRFFVEHTDRAGLARRIAQTRHEIEHVEQQRGGMSGANRSDEREFGAFYHEALFQELPHTGTIAHATRVALIDAALGHYYCLSAQLQQDNATRKQELLTRRQTEVTRSGRTDLAAAPNACSHPAATGTGQAAPNQGASADPPQPTPRVTIQVPVSPFNFQLPFSGSQTAGTMHNNYWDQASQPNIALGVVHSWRRDSAGRGWDLGGFVQGGANLALGSSLPTTGLAGTGSPRTLTGLGVQAYVQPAFIIFSIDIGGNRNFQASGFAQVGGGFVFSDIPGLQGWSINGQVGPQLSLDVIPNRFQFVGSATVGYGLNFPSNPLAGDPSVQGSPFWTFTIGVQFLLPVSFYPPSGGR